MKLKTAIFAIVAAVLSAISPVAVADECPLCVAAKNSDVAKVKRLLDGGANPNAADNFGNTVLYYAAVGGNAEVVKVLLSAGANPNAPNDDAPQRLSLSHEEVEQIVRNFRRMHEMEQKKRRDRAEMERILLELGISPSDFFGSESNKDRYIKAGEGIIFDAKEGKFVESAGVNPNAVGNKGTMALHVAARDGNAEIVKVLLSAGANPNTADNYGGTALRIANKEWSDAKTQEKAKEFQEVVRLLKEAGAKE